MNKLLTISIAAYNVEKTIEKCLDSFLASRFLDKLEILVINDGSSDRTAEIVRQYETKYPQSIRLINKENGGHGSTLNKSLSLATGRFYKAVDGDDWVDALELDKLCTWLERTDADLVIDDYLEVYPDHHKLISVGNKFELGKVYQFTELFTENANYNGLFVMSNSTIRTQCLRNVNMKIQEKCFYADTELYFYIGLAAKSVMFVNSCAYQYRRGNEGQSVSSEGIYKHIEDLIKIELNLISLYSKLQFHNISQIRQKYLFSIIDSRYTILFNCYTSVIKHSDKDKLFAEFLKKVYKQYPEIVNNMHLSLVNKYIVKNPSKRVPMVRHFKTTTLYKILSLIKRVVV